MRQVVWVFVSLCVLFLLSFLSSFLSLSVLSLLILLSYSLFFVFLIYHWIILDFVICHMFICVYFINSSFSCILSSVSMFYQRFCFSSCCIIYFSVSVLSRVIPFFAFYHLFLSIYLHLFHLLSLSCAQSPILSRITFFLSILSVHFSDTYFINDSFAPFYRSLSL